MSWFNAGQSVLGGREEAEDDMYLRGFASSLVHDGLS